MWSCPRCRVTDPHSKVGRALPRMEQLRTVDGINLNRALAGIPATDVREVGQTNSA
jgi:hypothetical protein